MKAIRLILTAAVALSLVSCDSRPNEVAVLKSRALVMQEFGDDVYEYPNHDFVFIARPPDGSVWVVCVRPPSVFDASSVYEIIGKTRIFDSMIGMPIEQENEK